MTKSNPEDKIEVECKAFRASTAGWMMISQDAYKEIWESPEGVRHCHPKSLGPFFITVLKVK